MSGVADRPAAWRSVPEEDWTDWTWQLKHRITTLSEIRKFIKLTDQEIAGIRLRNRFPFALTPYFSTLLDPDDPKCPIRRQAVPTILESRQLPYEMVDPLGEEKSSPLPFLVHRYPDRVLLLVTEQCAMYCRYCTRRRIVGGSDRTISEDKMKGVVRYLRRHRKVRDVLISGGDPLIFSDSKLQMVLEHLRSVPSIEVIRIGTRVPVTLPQRITPALVEMLRNYHPLWLSIHFSHPAEITPHVEEACGRLADAGIPLGSQTVLLAGINNDPHIMRSLMQKLLTLRVRPYYLYQCDMAAGTEHFRTPVDDGLKMIASLRGHTSGYAVPTYVIDGPGGGGKIPLSPQTVLARENGKLTLRNYRGDICHYYEPGAEASMEAEEETSEDWADLHSQEVLSRR